MTKRYFEFSEGTSNKFWEVWREGSVVNTRYGKIGAGGQTTLKDEGSEAGAEKLWLKLIGEKTKKGYIEKGGGKVAAAPKAAGAPKPAKVAAPKPASASASKPTALRGKTVVVTGTFAQPRKDLEKALVAAGCTVGGSVTPKTELLLVGADAGSKLAQAQKLGVPIMTEAEFNALASSTPADTTPSPKAKPAEWQVYADQLQAAGDPRGEVLALQLALEAKPKDPAALREAERKALKPLLKGPLADALVRFDALAAKLKANPKVKMLAYFTHEPVTEREIAKVEQALGVPLHASILTFFRQTNGLQLYAEHRDGEEFDDSTFQPVGPKYDKKATDAMSRFSENYQIAYGLHIPSLSEVFLADYEGQLWFDHMSDDNETEFGRKSFPELAFAKSLRVVDEHNGFYPIAFALIDQPGNPRIGLGDDYGVAWDSKVTDFEGFIGAVLKNDANQEKMERWFQR